MGPSASDGSGGERLLLGGWTQARRGSWWPSLRAPSDARCLVLACAARAALRGKCPTCPVPADGRRITAVQLSVLDAGILSDCSPSYHIQGYEERLFLAAVGVLGNSSSKRSVLEPRDDVRAGINEGSFLHNIMERFRYIMQVACAFPRVQARKVDFSGR